MNSYTLHLTELEESRGITLDRVAELMPKVITFDAEMSAVIPGGTGRTLAGAVARCALATPAVFTGMNAAGDLVFRPEHTFTDILPAY